uniref:Uncharacterized protein n=1 Tax=Siphoviridae sp. ctQ091 TaxID=2825490 RepID=A0A8S5NTT0_9CAUD|nr:MAG TPA: hypothetical protein [Siphoviridae sp. ctQ091]
MALTLGPRWWPVHPTEVRRPPQSGVLVHDVVSPPHPEHHERRMGDRHIRPRPPSHAITRWRTRYQSTEKGEERTPQLTRTDPS